MPRWVLAADIDADGDGDVLLVEWGEHGKIRWFENRGTSARAEFRNGGSNPASYVVTSMPKVGGRFSATVDVGMTGHTHACLFGYATPAAMLLPNGQFLLVNHLDPAGEMLGQMVVVGLLAAFNVPIPLNLSLLFIDVYTQAAHFGVGVQFELSNAQDLYLGH